MIEQADDVLFSQALKNNHHVLHTLLPNKLEITYQLRHRNHNLTLPRKSGSTSLLNVILLQGCYLKTATDCTYVYFILSFVFYVIGLVAVC